MVMRCQYAGAGEKPDFSLNQIISLIAGYPLERNRKRKKATGIPAALSRLPLGTYSIAGAFVLVKPLLASSFPVLSGPGFRLAGPASSPAERR
jgi:hypothetical protein